MMTKLFSMYPAPADFVASMASYLEDTRDVPVLFLSHALARLRDRPVYDHGNPAPRRWLPSISEIRYEAAKVVREFKLRSEGRNPNEYSPAAYFFEPEKWIQKAPEVVQQLLLAAPSLDRKQLAAGERG